MSRRFAVACAAATALLLANCEGGGSDVAGPPGKDTLEWRAQREQRLAREDGWLTLVGLHWLTPGETAFGAAEGLPLRLEAPGIPARAGVLILKDGTVRLRTAQGAPVTVNGAPPAAEAARADGLPLRDDAEGKPDVVGVGRLRFYVIRRAGTHLGVRIKDPEAPTRTQFKGLAWYPLDPRARVTARFIRYDRPREIEIGTATGDSEKATVPGELVFTWDGKEQRLLPFGEAESDLFLVFNDATSGIETYGAARFLDVPAPKDGTAIVDFNRAYNPPCVFTPFATCPLPPRENRLKVPIRAGEKKYEGPGAH